MSAGVKVASKAAKPKPKPKAAKKPPSAKPSAKRPAPAAKASSSKPNAQPQPQPRKKGPAPVNAPLSAASLLMLTLASLSENGPYQQRRTPATAEADAGLVESIRIMGVLQPILVRWDDGADLYHVVDGHRRVAAARAAGLEAIRALRVDTDERTSLAAGIAANLQRAALAPVDQWRALVHLQDMGWTLDGAAGALGIARRTARQLDKLGRLHPDMLGAIAAHDMPEEEELAHIAMAPHEVQAAAIKNPNGWGDDWDRREGTGTARKVPLWHAIASLCSEVRRIPQSRAIFDIDQVKLEWEEDLFAQPTDADRFTTRDIEGFLAAQTAALVAKTTRGKLRSVEWDAKAKHPRLPAGWTRAFDPKSPGVVRFAAVNPEGYNLGCIVEIQALPPPEPKGGAAPKAQAPAAEALGGKLGGDDAPDAPLQVGGPTQPSPAAESPEVAEVHIPTTPAAPAKGRGPLTEKGRILVAAAKTTAIRCALRDRRDHQAESLLCILVLALAGQNVSVRGDPANRYHGTKFHDLAARLVREDGTPEALTDADILAIAAEAAARIIVCDPTGAQDNTSGPAAEWIGVALEAHRDMPRLDTAEILATATGDALRAVAREAGMPVGGSSKALRDRLAGNAEGMTLPGSAFGAPGPVRAAKVPEGHQGPFPCEKCRDPEYCIAEIFCEEGAADE